MKKLILLACLGISVSLYAQTSNPITLNLQQALQLGLRNRFDLQADQYNIAAAHNEISNRNKAWIPEIRAEGSLQYNTQLQPTIIPKGILGNTKPEMVEMGAKNVSSFGLSLNQPVFKPGIHTDVKIATAQWALQKEKTRGQKIAAKNAIASAYLDVLLKRLQYQIARDEESRFERYSTLAAGKYKNGALIENDYLRAKLDYKNAKVTTATTQQSYALALIFLKYQINVPANTEIALSDSIGQITFSPGSIEADHFIARRTEIRQLKFQQQENALELKRTRQNALPSIALIGYYGQLYQNENFHYGQSLNWAPYSYVGLQFTVPITANFSNKNKIQNYQIRQKQLALNLQQENSDVRYEVQKSKLEMLNARENMQSAQQNYALSQRVYKNQQQQLDIGVFRYSDLLDTEKSLNHAEQNYMRAAYDYLVSKLAYQKAIGNL